MEGNTLDKNKARVFDSIKIYFNTGVWEKDLPKVIQGEYPSNTYIGWLFEYLKENKKIDFIKILEYGVMKLPEDSVLEEDLGLATFFFLASELKDVPEVIRDFALDMMLFAESSVSPIGVKKSAVVSKFKKLTSLLEQFR